MIVHLPFDAVLFDIDGTLVDSNDAHATTWVRALLENGHAWKSWRCGRSSAWAATSCCPLAGIEQPPEGQRDAARKKEIFHAPAPAAAYPGARALLQALRAGSPGRCQLGRRGGAARAPPRAPGAPDLVTEARHPRTTRTSRSPTPTSLRGAGRPLGPERR